MAYEISVSKLEHIEEMSAIVAASEEIPSEGNPSEGNPSEETLDEEEY